MQDDPSQDDASRIRAIWNDVDAQAEGALEQAFTLLVLPAAHKVKAVPVKSSLVGLIREGVGLLDGNHLVSTRTRATALTFPRKTHTRQN